MTKPTRSELIVKYTDRDPTPFVQFDGFIGTPSDPSDHCFHFDCDGHGLFECATWELMHGADVRVLIRPDVTAKDAAQILRKIRKGLKRGKPQSTVGSRWQDEECDDSNLPF